MILTDVRTGDRVRITTLVPIIATDDAALDAAMAQARADGRSSFTVPKIITPAGTCYEGIVTDTDSDGFFDLTMADGDTLCFYAHDDTKVIARIADAH